MRVGMTKHCFFASLLGCFNFFSPLNALADENLRPIGHGALACEKFVAAHKHHRSQAAHFYQWAYGYISGVGTATHLNHLLSKDTVGPHYDLRGELMDFCQANLETSFHQAVAQVSEKIDAKLAEEDKIKK